MYLPSGSPMRSKAAAQLSTTPIAIGSASPVSSHADIIIRRKIKCGSSPAEIILAIQYNAASGSRPLRLFIKALIMS